MTSTDPSSEIPPTLNDHLESPDPPIQMPVASGSASTDLPAPKHGSKKLGPLNVALIIITLLAIATAIYYGVYHQRTVTKTTTVIVKVTPSPSASPATSAVADQAAAEANVKIFYSNYLAVTPPVASYLTTAVQKGILTQAAANSVTANQSYNLPTCSQNPLTYSAYTFSPPTIASPTGGMTVTGTYTGPPAKTVTIDLTLQKVDGTWAINGFSCPGL